MLKAGKLDRIIRILQLPVNDEPGISYGVSAHINTVTANSWTVIASGVYAGFEDQGGTETERGGRLISERTAIFTIRFTSLVKEEHYIELDSLIWRIRSLEFIGRKEGLAITAIKTTKTYFT